ncbi:MAG: hypothetical protein JWR75_1121 [Devosia sp.]|nr:hypothetical protein [Devosia sp.]
MSTFDTARPTLPDPATAPELFEGVLPRRVFAWVIDCLIMGFMAIVFGVIGLIAGFFTFGLAWLGLFVLIPAVIVLYYAATLGSPNRATIGMQVMDLVLTPTRGRPLDGIHAFAHALVFWLTVWVAWPFSLAFALFTPRQQMIHDYVTSTLMLRRSPMIRHWSRMRSADNQE